MVMPYMSENVDPPQKLMFQMCHSSMYVNEFLFSYLTALFQSSDRGLFWRWLWVTKAAVLTEALDLGCSNQCWWSVKREANLGHCICKCTAGTFAVPKHIIQGVWASPNIRFSTAGWAPVRNTLHCSLPASVADASLNTPQHTFAVEVKTWCPPTHTYIITSLHSFRIWIIEMRRHNICVCVCVWGSRNAWNEKKNHSIKQRGNFWEFARAVINLFSSNT